MGARPDLFLSLYFFFQFFVISVFSIFCHYAKMVGNRFTEMVFFVWRPLNSLDGIIPNYVSWKGAQTVNERLFINSFFLFCFGVPVPCVPVCFESCFFTIFLLFYLHVFVCYPYIARMYLYVTRMLPVYTRMYSFVIGVYPYVLVCYSYVVVCYS